MRTPSDAELLRYAEGTMRWYGRRRVEKAVARSPLVANRLREIRQEMRLCDELRAQMEQEVDDEGARTLTSRVHGAVSSSLH
ncbi:MAG: hypothetical protein ACF8Q5_08105 [Phycisphaerales bacterium JB040]